MSVLAKWVRACVFSYDGIKRLLLERAFRQELVLLPVIICAIIAVDSQMHCVYLAVSYVILLITEALNTGIEITIDRISSEQHKLSKEAKDVGSAAVAIAIVNLIVAFTLCVVSCAR